MQSVWEKTAVRNQAAKARQTLNENRFEEIKQLEVEVRPRQTADDGPVILICMILYAFNVNLGDWW